MRVHAWQPATVWHDREANYAALRMALEERQPAPQDLVVLPEMFATGFSFKLEAVTEPEHGPTESFLREMARSYQIHLLGGWAGRTAEGQGQNLASLISPSGEVALRYTKVHPFRFVGEEKVFRGGDTPGLFTIGNLCGAVAICYDLRFPELFRLAVARGAVFFIVIANWPAARQAHWEALLLARAIENQAYVLGVNRVGADPKVNYAGGSCLIDPRGTVVAARGATPGFVSGELDLSALQEYRASFPALQDRKLI